MTEDDGKLEITRPTEDYYLKLTVAAESNRSISECHVS